MGPDVLGPLLVLGGHGLAGVEATARTPASRAQKHGGLAVRTGGGGQAHGAQPVCASTAAPRITRSLPSPRSTDSQALRPSEALPGLA